jgi:predicted Zn finger-like uncharacterized protein
MIVTCENCHTKFNVPDDKIGAAGRKVRCSSCHHIWLVKPPELELTEATAAKPQPKQEFTPKAEPRVVTHAVSEDIEDEKQVSRSLLKVAASFLIILNFGAFVFFNKDIIGQTQFYDMVGQYDTKAIEITSHDITSIPQAKGTNLQIAWVVKNTSTKPMKMPIVRFKLFDENLEVIGQKRNARDDQKLEAAQELKFKDTLIHNSKKARYFTVEIGN